ncbi:MAG: hypothetical protein OXC72_00040 [Roseovarius sp.]|nr:hypothetical protein [Roseovarius sp.]
MASNGCLLCPGCGSRNPEIAGLPTWRRRSDPPPDYVKCLGVRIPGTAGNAVGVATWEPPGEFSQIDTIFPATSPHKVCEVP